MISVRKTQSMAFHRAGEPCNQHTIQRHRLTDRTSMLAGLRARGDGRITSGRRTEAGLACERGERTTDLSPSPERPAGTIPKQ